MRNRTLLVLALVLGLALSADAATVRVKANGTPLRATASADGEILVRLNQGVLLDLVDVARDWYKVRDPQSKKEGFVLASLVELVPGGATTPPGPASAAKGQAAPPAGGKSAAPTRPLPPAKPGEWRDNGFVTVSGLFQATGTTFGYSFSPAEYAYAEQARINTHHPLDSGPALDLGGGMRVWRNMAVGATLSVFSESSVVDVDGTVPHPLYLNRDRAVTGTFASPRTEVGLHMQASWVMPVGRRTLVSLGGGPSYMHVKQAIADGINLSTVYPYDTSAVTGARTATVSTGRIGFNAGGDASYFVTRTIGVGGMVRFSRASVPLKTAGGKVSTNAGGLQAGVGVHVRLMPRGPKVPPKVPPKPPVKK